MNSDSPTDTGTPGQQPPRQQREAVGHSFFDWIRSLGVQRTRDRWIGGVSGAIAGQLGWDPLIVRIIWLALAFLGGFGVMLYGIAWMLLPDERDGRIIAQSAIEDGELPAGFWGALIFILIGCPASAPLSIPALILIAVLLGIRYRKSSKSPHGAPSQAPAGAPSAAFASSTAPRTGAPSATNASYAHNAPRTAGYAASARPGPVGPAVSTAPAAPAAPFTAKRKRPSAGPAVVGACAGIITITLGLVLLAYVRTGSPWNYAINGVDLLRALAIWSVASVAFLGVSLIFTGMAGRKGGGLTALSILMVVVALCATGMDYTARYSTIDGISNQQAVVRVTGSDATYTSSDFDALARGTVVWGSNTTIDLSNWNSIRDTTCPEGTLPLWATASTVTIRIPASCKATFFETGQSSFILMGNLEGGETEEDLDGAMDDEDSAHTSQAPSTEPVLRIPVMATASHVKIETV